MPGMPTGPGPNPFGPLWEHQYGYSMTLVLLVLVVGLGIAARLALSDGIPRYLKFVIVPILTITSLATALFLMDSLLSLIHLN